MMGNQVICHHCYSRRSPTPQEARRIRVLLVGLDNAGKTTAAKGLVGEAVADPAPTLGFSRLELRRRGWWVELFDVGGGRGIRGIWRNYLAECHGLVFVVDASDEARADECRAALHALLEDQRVRGKPVLLLANKQDVPSALDEVELNERLQLELVANQHCCPMRIELCSARLASHAGKKRHLAVATGFNWLTDYVIENHASLESRVAADLAVRAADLGTGDWLTGADWGLVAGVVESQWPADPCWLEAQIEEVFTRTEMGRLPIPESPALEKDSGQGSTKESDSDVLTSSSASQRSTQLNGIEGTKRRNRFFKRYTKTAPMPDDVRVTSLPSTPLTHQ
ncbi:ADP-ribosylation factor-like protein 13B [Pollicipes pollicipes]|uniref:ADP-ribosylation factor-like protein 13B n=1 Tax=Pollicipes pollicipes TaxID=41117 RepID=UPI001884C398|nr:ADP-ribosylation factor-like protein 13B [Pollicipes pollicipes]